MCNINLTLLCVHFSYKTSHKKVLRWLKKLTKYFKLDYINFQHRNSFLTFSFISVCLIMSASNILRYLWFCCFPSGLKFSWFSSSIPFIVSLFSFPFIVSLFSFFFHIKYGTFFISKSYSYILALDSNFVSGFLVQFYFGLNVIHRQEVFYFFQWLWKHVDSFAIS